MAIRAVWMTLTLTLVMLSACMPKEPIEMSQDTPGVHAELTAFTEAWIDAEVQGDRDALEGILDEKFLVTFASGKTIGRDAYIDLFVGAEIEPFEVTYEDIQVHGDTAVVINTIVGQPTKITWAAVKRGGQWRAVVQTFSKME